MDFKKFYKSIVRIESHDVGFDWFMPFQRKASRSSFGSGFFISHSGYILTCAHVVDNAERVTVEIPSEGDHRYETDVCGVCPFFDLAVLKIKDYTPKEICQLDLKNKIVVEVGMETYALGYPLGLPHLKVSKGIVSGQQYNFIQTDSAINPGNSGGPLVYQGKVIGVNAAGISAAVADGIGYAVPIRRFQMMKQLLFQSKRNLVHHPAYFGFEDFQSTSPDFQRYLNNGCKSGGVYVKRVLSKSPVSSTKLKAGDVLCKLNGISIDFYGKLSKRWMNENMTIENMLGETRVGDSVRMEYWNGGKMCAEKFELTDFVPRIRKMYPAYEKVDYVLYGGIIIMDLSQNLLPMLGRFELLEYAKPKNLMEKRIVVSNILDGGYVSRIGILERGDLLTRINDHRVCDLTSCRKALNKPLQVTRKKKSEPFLKIETEGGKLMVFPVNILRAEEVEMAERYQFSNSHLLSKKIESS
jgi:S1-C subfamily serine protease